ncbi:peptidase U62, modulator of DNA gyrase [Acidilobus saccharovorans 345-15]|uniref:Peptidase U62, modulator of DNA gyrase n=1 Tax=Acidilobus saccharovorans (strain DSM 16705 / JCM 18335 / VKM B-2471 / 345-15) TaxID=666510 RepID=D9PZ64_ACIS3|nr:zinc metalloprotease TldD [Acidilobus saccharovorans]ADL19851.1 peptidase U62, modulator of DNA gyrase [Acidilobus saccharovorans 345-15]
MEVIDEALRLGASFADLRYYRAKTLVVTSSEARDLVNNYGISEGYALRALVNGSWGYYTTSSEVTREAAGEAVRSASGQGNAKVYLLSPLRDRVRVREKYPLDRDPLEVMNELRKVREQVRAAEPRVKSITVSYAHVQYDKGYWSSDGRDLELSYSISRVSLTAVAREGDIVASAYASASTYLGYALEAFDVSELVDTLLRRLRAQLRGVAVKPGQYQVVLSPDVSGVFAHEALGHLAEADLAVNGILGKLRGKRIGAEFVNVSDSPQLDEPMAIGITPYDDEGVRGREVKIIEGGVVKELMNDRSYAASLGEEPTGNGRAEDFRSSVIVRMRNTYFKPGDMTLDELLEDVKDGFLMESVMGGQTSSDGTFQFGIQEGYRVVNGEVREPIRGAGIAGYTIETIGNIDGVSRDFRVWPGVCGKSGQSVFVGTGGPYVRVSKLKVG